MKKNRFGGRWATFFLAAGLFSTILISCTEKEADKVKQRTVTDIIRENPEFSILKEIVQSAKASDAFRTQNATIFLPSNAAFAKAEITSASVITSMSDPDVDNFLKAHVLKGLVKYGDLKTGTYESLDSKRSLVIAKKDTAFTVNGSKIAKTDVIAANAIIQVVDSMYVKISK